MSRIAIVDDVPMDITADPFLEQLVSEDSDAALRYSFALGAQWEEEQALLDLEDDE